MTSESPIVIVLDRAINVDDERAISKLRVQWLIYDAKVQRKRSTTAIRLFHSTGAKPDLVREINQLFPNENITGI